MESCWINSCLQLILTMIDHTDHFEQIGSPLWNNLMKLIHENNSSALNPIPVRDILIEKERDRIIRQNIAPVNRLFDLGSSEIFKERNLLLESFSHQSLGQQDCKDFFICLAENREHWPDV